jgi:DNA-directed RNA polymerase specialized sigma24 family protein
MIENYNKARRYLYKVDPINYKDILHDAYVNYHRRTGGLNLFERSNTNVIGVVRNQYYERFQKMSYQKNKTRHQYQFVEYEDSPSNLTPIDFLIEKETFSTFIKRAEHFRDSDTAKEVLNHRLDGYTPEETAEKLNITKNRVNWIIRGLKQDRTNNYVKEVDEIRRLYQEGKSLKQLSVKFQRSATTIRNIIIEKYHKTNASK